MQNVNSTGGTIKDNDHSDKHLGQCFIHYHLDLVEKEYEAIYAQWNFGSSSVHNIKLLPR